MSTCDNPELAGLLKTLEPGDSMQFGELLAGISSETVDWQFSRQTTEGYEFSVYYFGVYIGTRILQRHGDHVVAKKA